jgi:hypothetical protein
MGEAKELDRMYFETNPTAFSYERAPLPQEWTGVKLPADAHVSVYRINDMSRVRALQSRRTACSSYYGRGCTAKQKENDLGKWRQKSYSLRAAQRESLLRPDSLLT